MIKNTFCSYHEKMLDVNSCFYGIRINIWTCGLRLFPVVIIETWVSLQKLAFVSIWGNKGVKVWENFRVQCCQLRDISPPGNFFCQNVNFVDKEENRHIFQESVIPNLIKVLQCFQKSVLCWIFSKSLIETTTVHNEKNGGHTVKHLDPLLALSLLSTNIVYIKFHLMTPIRDLEFNVLNWCRNTTTSEYILVRRYIRRAFDFMKLV